MNSWGDDLLNKMKLATKIKVEEFKISFKRRVFILFLWSLGLITGISFYYFYDNFKELSNPRVITIVNVAQADQENKEVIKEEKKEDTVDEIADYIWLHESTRGLKNYSKCEEKGLVNGMGFGIPGNGKYQCFKSHEDEMLAVKGWIVDKLSRGYSEKELKCLYSGNNYDICK